MLKQSTDPDEFMRVWASDDGTRCALATVEGVLELRLVSGGRVVRRQTYPNLVRALAAAQQWRVGWEMEGAACDLVRTAVRCPQCRAAHLSDVDLDRLIQWFLCGSCGHVWALHQPVRSPSESS